MSGFYDDLYAQPAAIRQTVAAIKDQLERLPDYAEQLRSGAIQRVIFTGMGGSYAAGTHCQLALIKRGILALGIESSELIADYSAFLTPQTLIVAISQSGRSVEIVRLLDVLQSLPNPSPVIGLTNTVGCPLETRSTFALMTQAGVEENVSTKTYTASLAALHLLAAKLTGESLEQPIHDLLHAADILEAQIPIWREQMGQIAEQIFPNLQFIEYIGRGSARASALTGALISKETAKMPTEGMLGGQFRHGPIEGVDEKVTIVVFMGTGNARELNDALVRDVATRGCPVIAIGTDVSGATAVNLPAHNPDVTALIDIVPVQLLAGALASLRGFTPGKFRYSSKVTTTE